MGGHRRDIWETGGRGRTRPTAERPDQKTGSGAGTLARRDFQRRHERERRKAPRGCVPCCCWPALRSPLRTTYWALPTCCPTTRRAATRPPSPTRSRRATATPTLEDCTHPSSLWNCQNQEGKRRQKRTSLAAGGAPRPPPAASPCGAAANPRERCAAISALCATAASSGPCVTAAWETLDAEGNGRLKYTREGGKKCGGMKAEDQHKIRKQYREISEMLHARGGSRHQVRTRVALRSHRRLGRPQKQNTKRRHPLESKRSILGTGIDVGLKALLFRGGHPEGRDCTFCFLGMETQYNLVVNFIYTNKSTLGEGEREFSVVELIHYVTFRQRAVVVVLAFAAAFLLVAFPLFFLVGLVAAALPRPRPLFLH